FHFKEWDYWASNADWEWGPWCTESGWAQPWIAGTFALREMKTSLWDLLAKNDISPRFDEYRKQMLPDEKAEAAPALAAAPKQKPNVSLTLIPPSPVTDKIAVDARGAVWNRGDESVEFDVAFYLDEETPANLLHREKLKVAAKSAAGASFRWPTKGRAGKHRIVFQASCSGDALRTVQALEVLASDVRSTRGIDGAWIEFYHWSEAEGRLWNAEIKRMTDGQWRELVRGMHEIGMNVGVIQDVFRQETNQYVGKHDMNVDNYPGKAMYPSRLYTARLGLAAKDPVEAVLAEADALGMRVFMGVGGFAWFDFTCASLEWHKKIAAELWEMYGHHPSFYGWYVSDEVAGNLGTDPQRRSEIVEFFREFTAHCRSMAPDKPVMLATNCHGVKEGRDAYPELLPHLDILCPFGFHRMPEGDYTGEEAAAVLQKLCDDAGAHLWMDLEAFLFDGGGALYPRPIHGLIEDLNRFPTFEKILCYQYPGLFNAPWASRKPGGENTVALYRHYKAYREGGVEALEKVFEEGRTRHAARGRPVRLASGYSPMYPGGGDGALTDGATATQRYQDPAWQGFHGADLDAAIDLGKTLEIKSVAASFLQDTAVGIFLPSRVVVSASDDGKSFQRLAEVDPGVDPREPGPLVRKLMAENLKTRARYLRVQAANVGVIPDSHGAKGKKAWLFVDEILVNPEGEKQ
ncbi:MAG TPA: DUF4434 domain-containing protein, partial [Sumerlaeia bacterium]|nr:DUF4434 domain-containing protein [Sumerlaeia bacterium]